MHNKTAQTTRFIICSVPGYSDAMLKMKWKSIQIHLLFGCWLIHVTYFARVFITDERFGIFHLYISVYCYYMCSDVEFCVCVCALLETMIIIILFKIKYRKKWKKILYSVWKFKQRSVFFSSSLFTENNDNNNNDNMNFILFAHQYGIDWGNATQKTSERCQNIYKSSESLSLFHSSHTHRYTYMCIDRTVCAQMYYHIQLRIILANTYFAYHRHEI